MNRVIGMLLVATMLGAGMAPLATSQAPPSDSRLESAPWWHPGEPPTKNEFREGWNLRIPLTVTSDHLRHQGAPVQVHLDLAQSLIEGGWPETNGIPPSFTAYPDAVRLVEYDPDWQAVRAPGDADLPSTCEDASCPPFKLFPTWLDSEQDRYDKKQSGGFHGQRNAVVTLEWLLPRDLEPAVEHNYFVYFDIEQNAGPKPDQEHRKQAPTTSAEGRERMDGLYWVGAGTTLYGYSPESTTADTMVITAGQPDTQVQIFRYAGTTPQPAARPGIDPQFCLLCDDNGHKPSQGFSLGLDETHFKVVADKPVAVATHRLVASPGARTTSVPEFVPSQEGGLLGWSFDIPHVATRYHVITPPGATEPTLDCTPGPCRRIVIDKNDQDPARVESLRVTNGGPVLVQFTPKTHGGLQLAQVPTGLGSPVGESFQAHTMSGYLQGCPFSSPVDRGFWVSPWETDVLVQVFDNMLDPQYEDPRKITHPEQQNLNRVPRTCSNAPEPLSSVRVTEDPEGDKAPIMVHAGGSRQDHRTVAQSTPFGGRHGLEFQVRGPFAVYNYYPTTDLRLTHPDDSHESRSLSRIGFPLEFTHHSEDGQETPLDPEDDLTIIEADKPVSVFPLGEPKNYARFMAAKPDFLVPEIHPGQYRGYLFDIHLDGGIDPVFMTAQPGGEVATTFQVHNLAKWDDGDVLEDTVKLSATVESEDWDGSASVGTTFADREMELADSSLTPNRLTIQLPQDDELSNKQITVRVRATSAGNPQMFQDFSVVLMVKQTFGVDLWFGPPSSEGGPRDKPLKMTEGAKVPVEFVVRNEGSGIDSFDLAIPQAPGGGWDASITDRNGQPVTSIEDLGPGEQEGVILAVRAPLTPQLTAVTVPITAVSQSSPALASDLITVSAKLDLEQGLELQAEELRKTVMPGQTERFHVTLHNTGEDGLEIRLSLDAAVPDGWVVSFADGSQEFERSMLPDDPPVQIAVDVTAGDDAPADEFLAFLVSAEGLVEGAEVRDAISLSATVGRSHLLDIQAFAPLVTVPGKAAETDIHVENLGNTPEQVHLEPVAVPGGWKLTGFNESRAMGPGTSGNLTIGIEPPPNEPPGEVTLILQARSGGPAFPFHVVVDVQEVHEIGWRPVATSIVQPGDTHEVTLFLENKGNVEEHITLGTSASWPVRLDVENMDIPPGSVGTVQIATDIPMDTAGMEREFEVTAQAESGPSEPLSIPVRVVAAQLEADDLVQTRTPSGPGSVGSLMMVLRNPGEAPVRNAEVRLVGDPDILFDKVQFQSIGPDGSVTAPMRWIADAGPAPQTIQWGHWVGDEFRVLGSAPVSDARAGEGPSQQAPAPLFVLLSALLAATGMRRGGRR